MSLGASRLGLAGSAELQGVSVATGTFGPTSNLEYLEARQEHSKGREGPS